MKNQLDFQTSEKVMVHMEIATVLYRALAFFIDIIFQIVAFYILYLLFVVVLLGGMAFLDKNQAGSNVFALVSLVVFGVILLGLYAYHLVFELIWNGQTPGKRLLHMRAVSTDGFYASKGAIILRNLFRIVDWLPGIPLVGLITMLINHRNQRVGDLVAGTVVVREAPLEIPATVPEVPLLGCFQGVVLSFSPVEAEKEQRLIENYFSLAKGLTEEKRLELEQALVKRAEDKTGVRKAYDLAGRRFLASYYGMIIKNKERG